MIELHEFIELTAFRSKRDKYFDDEKYREFQRYLLANIDKGDRIKGTGGFRKIRFSLEEGKSGGVRVIYYFMDRRGRIYLTAIYAKAEKESLTRSQENEMKKLAIALEEECKNG